MCAKHRVEDRESPLSVLTTAPQAKHSDLHFTYDNEVLSCKVCDSNLCSPRIPFIPKTARDCRRCWLGVLPLGPGCRSLSPGSVHSETCDIRLVI